MEALAHLCENFEEIYEFENDFANNSIYDVIDDMALESEETLSIGYWQRTAINASKYFIPVLTEEGKCFAFNSLNSDDIYTDE